MEKEKQSTREMFLMRLKLGLALLALGFWTANVIIDEATMVLISGASQPTLDYWETKGAGFALIAAVCLFAAMIPSRKGIACLAPTVIGALAALSSGYCWLEGGTGGNIGGYIVAIVIAGALIAVSLIAGPALYGVAQVVGALLGWLGRATRLDRLEDPIKWAVTRVQASQRGPQ